MVGHLQLVQKMLIKNKDTKTLNMQNKKLNFVYIIIYNFINMIF